MQIIATDDEALALESLLSAIAEANPSAVVNGFHRGGDALAFARSHPCDIAFLDIEMRDMNGLELAKQLKGIHPQINIVFVTGYNQYMAEAYGLYVSGYVTKPASGEKISRELENLRHPVAPPGGQLRVQCFGNFEVFADETPVRFQYQKTKEMFAYLIDRKGAVCTVGEIMAVLWEDDAGLKKRSYMSNLMADLVSTFAGLGFDDVLCKRRGILSVVPEHLQCDYYDWDKGLTYAINAYRGEYMSQFSWAESTLSEIERSLQ